VNINILSQQKLKILVILFLVFLLVILHILLIDKFFQIEPSIIIAIFIIILFQNLYFPKQITKTFSILIIVSLGVFSATRFFQIAQINPYHTHELYHYVIGGKYFSYLGYKGLYAATAQVLVDKKILEPTISVRDLSNKTNTYLTGWQSHAKTIQQAMPPHIWQMFAKDIEFFSLQLGNSATAWHRILHDHGFNPSPLWVLEASPILHSFPLPQIYTKLIYFDYIIIIAMSIIFLFLLKTWFWRFAAFTAYWIILAYYPAVGWQSYIWITGSVLRYSWFLYFALGMFFIIQQRYFWAGFGLALAGLERIFPLGFFAIAGIFLLIDFIKCNSKNFQLNGFIKTPLFQFSLGGCIILMICIVLYSSFFPFSYLEEFAKNMSVHSELLADNHVGYKSLATYTDVDRKYNIWQTHQENVVNLNEVIEKNQSDAYANKIYKALYEKNWVAKIFRVILLILLVLVIFNYMNLISATLFGGTALIYYLTLMSYYYQIFFAIYAVVLIYLIENSTNKNNQHHLFLLLIFIASISLVTLNITEFIEVSLIISIAQWFFFPLIAIYYISPSLRHQLATVIFMGVCAVWILSYNFHYVSAAIPPYTGFKTLLTFDGQSLSKVMPDAPMTTHTYLDENAARIEDSGVTLFTGGEIYFNLFLPDKTQHIMSVVIRSNFSYPVALSLYSNKQQVINAHQVEKIGYFWNYLRLDIPASYLQVGNNEIRLVLEQGEALELYRMWCGYMQAMD